MLPPAPPHLTSSNAALTRWPAAAWSSGTPAFWTFYALLILGGWFLARSVLADGLEWTYVHLAHSALSFFFMHWRKGSPFQDHGQYHQLTFWEQLDHGEQNTDNRKFFAAVPAALFFLAARTADFRQQPLLLNFLGLLLCLVPKLSEMHRVRVLGINED